MKHLVAVALSKLRRFDEQVIQAEGQRATASVIVATTILLVPLFSAWQVARSAAGTTEPMTISMSVDPPPLEPIFSVRRVARTAAIEARVATARTRLSALADELPSDSCLVVRAESRDIVNLRPARPLIPASNMKLLVAAAAMEVLGPDYRFNTVVLGNRIGATVTGNLWLIGGGDPLLSTRAYPATQVYPTVAPTYLDSLVDEIVASGITSVAGSVVGDESRYDDERYVPTWGDGIRSIEAGPLGALLVDDGVLIGDPFKPANPALGAAMAFTRLLESRGVRVLGAPRSNVAPIGTAELGRITSAPLSSIMVDLLTNSDNNVAELLLKEIGLVSKQKPTRAAGLQTVAEVLEANGVPVQGSVFADGSGLDGSNRVSCDLLVTLLEKYGLNSVVGQSLALAGVTGTLEDQFVTGPARNRVRAKTGTLRLAKTLSGFFPMSGAVDENVVVFSLILNGAGVSNQTAYRPVWNELMVSLAAFNSQPATDDLLPRPQR